MNKFLASLLILYVLACDAWMAWLGCLYGRFNLVSTEFLLFPVTGAAVTFFGFMAGKKLLAPGRPGSRNIALAGLGLFAWLLAQWIAFGMAAGGDGWDSPSALSLIMLPAFPLALVSAFGVAAKRLKPLLPLVLALLADWLLVVSMIANEQDYFQRVWRLAAPMALAWLAIWAAWQVLLVASLLRRPSAGGPAAPEEIDAAASA